MSKMYSMLVTLEVPQLPSAWLKEEALANMYSRGETAEVFQLSIA